MKINLLLLSLIFGLKAISQPGLKVDTLKNFAYSLEIRWTTGYKSYGTGCIIRYNLNYYLVTNYHVLSGKDPVTRENRHPEAGLPTEVSIRFFNKAYPEIPAQYPILLYTNHRSNFKCLPNSDLGPLDVATLHIGDRIPSSIIASIIDWKEIDSSLELKSGSKLLISGFPGNEPARVASIVESKLLKFDKGLLYFDKELQGGMSGSPIFIVDKNNKAKLAGLVSFSNSAINNQWKGAGYPIAFALALIQAGTFCDIQ